MSAGRYIFIALLILSNVAVASVGGPRRVICYGADGHVAIEGPAEMDACRARGGVAVGHAAGDLSLTLEQTGCTDLSISSADRPVATHPTSKLNLPTLARIALTSSLATANQVCPRTPEAYHSPPGLSADLASLRMAVLLI